MTVIAAVALIAAGYGAATLLQKAEAPGAAVPAAEQASAPMPAGTSSAETMTAKAAAFVASLDADQRSLTLFALDSPERGRWSNIPVGGALRSGLRVGDMTEAQRVLLHALLRASMSSQGYLEVAGVMHMDQILRELNLNPPPNLTGEEMGAFWPGPIGQGPANTPASEAVRADRTRVNATALGVPPKNDGLDYYVSVFGEPAAGDEWAFLVSGHHLAASFTVSQGRVAFTPLFLGSQPFEVKRGPEAGWSPLHAYSDRGLELMRSLTPEQQAVALVSTERSYQVMTGPGRRNSITQYEGLKTSQLDASQMRLLRVLVEEYVRNADVDAAEAQLLKIAADGWDNLWFSWRGPVGENEFFYYRVHGPHVIIELAWEARNHVHTIVRDPTNDYGEDWLGKHYEEQHMDMTETNDNLADYIRRGEELERQTKAEAR